MRAKADEQAKIVPKTKWIIEVDKHTAASGIDWAGNFLAHFNTEQLL